MSDGTITAELDLLNEGATVQVDSEVFTCKDGQLMDCDRVTIAVGDVVVSVDVHTTDENGTWVNVFMHQTDEDGNRTLDSKLGLSAVRPAA